MSSLDLLLLALISDGLNTPYAIRQASVSIGASQPALRRLLAAKLVRKGSAGIRKKAEYTLTPQGRSELENWRHLADEYRVRPPRDLESLLRIAAIGIVRGNSTAVAELLDAAMQSWSARSQHEAAAPPLAGLSLADVYKRLLSHAERSRLRAEAEALRAVKKDLEQLRPRRSRRQR